MHASFSSLPVKIAITAAVLNTFLALSPARAQQVQTVWYIYLENRNWTENETSGGAQLFGSSAAPYINSLVTPGNANATEVSYCSQYHNDLAGPTAAIPPSQGWIFNNSGPSATVSDDWDIHPSEPNYVWQEAGLNLSKYDDNDPYGSGASVSQINTYLANNPTATGQHITGLLQSRGISWKTYQEGIDLATTGGGVINTLSSGSLTNAIAPTSEWTVPLQSFSGSSGSYTNPYNSTHQYNFACKHCGPLFFTDTNGSTVTTANYANSNPETFHYAPLEQLQTDLNNSACGAYNIITPDQYNDMHTALTGGFTYNGTHYTGDSAQIAQGDNFLSIVVPRIMASSQFQNNGAIIIWTDETEGTGQDAFNHTLEEILISPLARGNAYNSTLNYTHSSDVATMQEIFGLPANTVSGWLNDATNLSNANTTLPSGQVRDLSDLFKPGVIPSLVSPSDTPTMPFWLLAVLGALLLLAAAHLLPVAHRT
jgi:phosphatidylinositol-3-phosphatase